MNVQDLAALLESPWEGDGSRDVTRVAPLEEAGGADLSFVTKGKTLALAATSAAGCLLVPEDFDNANSRTVIRVKNPRAAVARAIAVIHPKKRPEPGVHPTAIIGAGSTIGEGSSVGPYVTIGENSRIGAGCSIGAGTAIGDGVVISDQCTLHPRLTLYSAVTLGKRVVLHSGCVIGADGFGYVLTGGAYENFPQVGRVEIGDRVEIGANSCVDRAAIGVTSIGEGTKLDNMVHVGHNCKIGKHVVIAAQTGLAGGVVVEDYAVIGGQVGIGDKVRIESRAVLGSGSGVLTSKVVRSGQVVWGTPARPLKQYLEQLAVLSRLAKGRKKAHE
ncbi:MAG: UDP-3-O-(3-hydroxymyristoyl)glucosamine N-acyltransferase [Bryobacteraceae bacterium]